MPSCLGRTFPSLPTGTTGEGAGVIAASVSPWGIVGKATVAARRRPEMIAPDAEIDPAAILAAVQWLESKRDVVEALVQELREIAEAEIRAGEDISQLTADALMAVTRELHDLNAQMHQLLERLVPVVPREADEA